MSIKAMKQALEALEIAQNNLAPSRGSAHAYGDGELWDKYDEAITTLRTAIEAAEKPKYDQIELHVLHSHIAGVLFDFMGWLTTRERRLTLSSTDEAGPAVEAITEFAKMRGLRLEDAQVEHWQTILTTPPAAPVRNPLTDEQIQDLLEKGNPTEDEARLIRLGYAAAQPADQGQSCYCPNCEALSKQIAAQRQWVGLMDEEIEDAFQFSLALYIEEVDPDFYSVSSQADYVFARAIEAKLKEKNT